MYLNLEFLVVVAAVILTTCNGAALLDSNEEDARMFLEKTSDKMNKFYDEEQSKAFSKTNNDYKDAEADKTYTIFLSSIFEDIKKYDYKNFKDQELKFAFETLIDEIDIRIVGKEKIEEWYNAMRVLEELKSEQYIDQYDDSSEQLVYSPDIEDIIETSKNPDELLHYWKKWNLVVGNWGDNNLKVGLDILKTGAELLEISPLEFWSQGYNISDMEKMMADIQPLYNQVHSFIRSHLNKKYPDAMTGYDGLIPIHLFEQARSQIGSIIGEIYPNKDVPYPDTRNFTSEQMYKIADKFFEDLGFEKYPSEFWGDRIRMYVEYDSDLGNSSDHSFDLEQGNKTELEQKDKHKNSNEHHNGNKDDIEHKVDHQGHEDSKREDDNEDEDLDEIGYDGEDDCSPRIWFYTPNVYLEYCDQMTIDDFFNAYYYMSNLYYAKQMKGLPSYYFNHPISLERSIGKAMILSSSTHHNLQQIGMIPHFETTEYIEMDRLLRKGIPGIFLLTLDFVNVKMMEYLLTNEFDIPKINEHYWMLLHKYAGISKPKDINDVSNTLQLPFDLYDNMMHNDMSMEVTSDVLSFQIYKRLCELSGNYPKEQLHLCDISGSKEAGTALKKMMQLGVSKPFYQVLATMFPENPTVRTESLLEYYSPMNKFITEKNKESDEKPGWKKYDAKNH